MIENSHFIFLNSFELIRIIIQAVPVFWRIKSLSMYPYVIQAPYKQYYEIWLQLKKLTSVFFFFWRVLKNKLKNLNFLPDSIKSRKILIK